MTGLTHRPSRLAGGFFVLLYYIPIYFQAVRNTTATNSGIRNLALIIADSMSPIFPWASPRPSLTHPFL